MGSMYMTYGSKNSMQQLLLRKDGNNSGEARRRRLLEEEEEAVEVEVTTSTIDAATRPSAAHRFSASFCIQLCWFPEAPAPVGL
jgi:hypothetical protein